MSNSDNVKVYVDEDRIGKAAGREVADAIGDLQGRDGKTLTDLDQSIGELEGRIEQLERRVTEVERTKAEARQEAAESLRERLEQRARRKRDEYEQRITEVLDDYRERIERLKDRFLRSIGSQGDRFEQVEAEFDRVRERRAAVTSAASTHASAGAASYDDRARAVARARDRFLERIDDFQADRRGTAETIDALQTDVPRIDGATTIQVPFWVAGIRRDGAEEIRVWPVLDRGEPGEAATRRQPYVDYLTEHPTHWYGDMVEAVREQASRESVRDRLASREGPVASPEFLRRQPGVADRFVDALARYQHQFGAAGGSPPPEGQTDEHARAREVASND